MRNIVVNCSEKEFDALEAEKTLKEFCAFIRSVISRFDENKRLQEEAEAKEQDLKHYIEMTNGLSDDEIKILYMKIVDALQLRRSCKSENELLKPLYEFVADKKLLNHLCQIQGLVGSVKKTIKNRSYACRTDILDDFRVTKSDYPDCSESTKQ